MLTKLTTELNFINVLHTAFMSAEPKSVNRYWWLNCIFYAFGIYEHKSCSQNIDEINTRFLKVFPLNWNNIYRDLFNNVPCHLTCPPNVLNRFNFFLQKSQKKISKKFINLLRLSRSFWILDILKVTYFILSNKWRNFLQ